MGTEQAVKISPWMLTGLVLVLGATVVLGIWPQPLISFAHQASAALLGGTSRQEALATSAFPTQQLCPSLHRRRLVAEVAELQGDPEILLLQLRDHRLQVVALLARDPDLVALGL